MVNKKKDFPLVKTALFQALGLTAYCGLIGSLLSFGENLFNRIPEYLAPLIMLVMLSTSALVCGLITLSIPFKLFFTDKQPKKAIKLVSYTVLFLVLFIFLFVSGNYLLNK